MKKIIFAIILSCMPLLSKAQTAVLTINYDYVNDFETGEKYLCGVRVDLLDNGFISIQAKDVIVFGIKYPVKTITYSADEITFKGSDVTFTLKQDGSGLYRYIGEDVWDVDYAELVFKNTKGDLKPVREAIVKAYKDRSGTFFSRF